VGTFDVVFVSDLLLHLRDPQRALETIFTVVKDSGCLLMAEPYDQKLEGIGMPVRRLVPFSHYVWSLPSSSALERMMNVAGFNPIEEVGRLPLNYSDGYPIDKLVLRGYPWQAHREAGNIGGNSK
jgi:SAM-dependent methyltransferase